MGGLITFSFKTIACIEPLKVVHFLLVVGHGKYSIVFATRNTDKQDVGWMSFAKSDTGRLTKP